MTFADLPVHEDAKPYLIRDLADSYELQVVPLKAPLTQKSNHRSLQEIRSVFGHIPIDRIEPSHCYDFYNARHRTKAAVLTYQVLSHMYTKAVEWGYIKRHPLKGQVVLTRPPPRDRYVTDEELLAFRELASPKLQAYLDLKLATGLPKEDLLCLDRRDIQEDGLHARRRKTKARPKVYAWDDEGLLAAILESVMAAHKGHVGCTRLFHTRDGKPYYEVDDKGHALGQPEGFNSMWQRLMRKWVSGNRERFTEHDIRAKSASDTDLVHAQLLMDHVNSNTTETIYRRKPKVVQILSHNGREDA